jgi:serine/threonine protein kinase
MKVEDRTPERLGQYRLIRRIGEGGMGVVYLAADAQEQPVAVKVLHPGLAQEDNARRRLAREVETMRRVHSRYVAEVVGADLAGDPPYIVTRYVPGLTLDAVVASGGPLAGYALARLARGLAEALAAVHAAGVVHRDLKPGNVMISDGEPVVIDFGIAHLPETTRLTVTGMFMGTPGYLAPEVIEGKDSGPASDVHSWAATLAFAATGRPPFGTGAFETIFFRIMHGQPDLDTLPAPLSSLVTRALSRDPADRPSAAVLAQWAASLDPGSLVPSPPAESAAAGGQANAVSPLPHTLVDQSPPLRAWPHSTMPLTTVGGDDVRDLLPPVSYQPAGGGQATVGAGESPGWPGSGQARAPGPSQPVGPDGEVRAGPGLSARQGAARTVGPVSSWSPLVLACVAMLVALGVVAPVIGTAIAIGVLLALRAASITGRQLGKRRAAGGGTRVGGTPAGRLAGDSLMAIALYPVALLRSVIVFLVLAPVALLGFVVAAAATIVLVHSHPFHLALAYGAGALVAVSGIGPGSTASRELLARWFTAAGRTPGRLAIVYVGMLAIATWAGLTAWSAAPTYWPMANLHVQITHLPTFRTLLTDVRQSLLRLAHRFGL